MIAAATGIITTVAGNGTQGSSGDTGSATAAQLNLPQGVTLDGNGNLYIADTSNHRIRMVSAATGTITTVAGKGTINANGSGAYSGDGGLATAAELNFPHAVAFDAAGNMYIPDTANNRVREVSAVGGAITASSTITTFAGDGTPSFAGDGAAANLAELWGPSGVAVDAAGNVFIADTQNSAIRKVSPATLNISTLVQSGVGFYYYGSAVNYLDLYGPTGLYLDGKGNLFIADTLNMVVRELQGNVALLYYKTPVRQFDKSAPMSQTVENDGNLALDLTAIAAGAMQQWMARQRPAQPAIRFWRWRAIAPSERCLRLRWPAIRCWATSMLATRGTQQTRRSKSSWLETQPPSIPQQLR